MLPMQTPTEYLSRIGRRGGKARAKALTQAEIDAIASKGGQAFKRKMARKRKGRKGVSKPEK